MDALLPEPVSLSALKYTLPGPVPVFWNMLQLSVVLPKMVGHVAPRLEVTVVTACMVKFEPKSCVASSSKSAPGATAPFPLSGRRHG